MRTAAPVTEAFLPGLTAGVLPSMEDFSNSDTLSYVANDQGSFWNLKVVTSSGRQLDSDTLHYDPQARILRYLPGTFRSRQMAMAFMVTTGQMPFGDH
jgi:hypothetical protein